MLHRYCRMDYAQPHSLAFKFEGKHQKGQYGEGGTKKKSCFAFCVTSADTSNQTRTVIERKMLAPE